MASRMQRAKEYGTIPVFLSQKNVQRQAPGSWHPWGKPASLKRSGYTQGARSPVDLDAGAPLETQPGV
eukprot:2428174-Prymnesium_polylepis.1